MVKVKERVILVNLLKKIVDFLKPNINFFEEPTLEPVGKLDNFTVVLEDYKRDKQRRLYGEQGCKKKVCDN